MINNILTSLLVYLIFQLNGTNGIRIADKKIYRDVETKYFCFRRLNGTHQFGCQSDYGGNIGVLHYVSSSDDVKWLASDERTSSYMPVINIEDLTTSLMKELKEIGKITGVMVIKRNETTIPESRGFSSDSSCPNDAYGLYSSKVNQSYAEYGQCSRQKWNPENPVLNLLFEDFGFPVLMVEREEDITNIHECIIKYGVTADNPNRSWPLCSAELYIHMNAAKDSKTCMRRNSYDKQFDIALRYCDPMGSYNVFTPIYRLKENQTLPEESLVVLAARTDALSFFYDKTPGADSPLSGIVVLLSVAQTLARIKEKLVANRKNNKNVLIAFFAGESFDYIGSGRTAYDLKNKKFNENIFTLPEGQELKLPSLSLNHLSSFIEVNQLAPHSSPESKNVWLHIDPISNRQKKTSQDVQDLMAKLKASTDVTVKEAPKDIPLPPASLQSFLREKISLPGIVLTNHERQFENKFYNSFLDDTRNIGFENETTSKSEVIVQHLAAVSSTISQTLYQLVTLENDASIKSDSETIRKLLYCFAINSSCPLFLDHGLDISQWSQLAGLSTLPFYVTVAEQTTSSSILAYLLTYLMSSFTGTVIENVDREQCFKLREKTEVLKYTWVKGTSSNGTCIESQVFSTPAISPVFQSTYPDWDLNYSTWTESVWNGPSARIFLQPGPTQEWLTLAAGILITILSFLIVKFLQGRAGTIFKSGSDNSVSLMRENNVDC